MYPEELTQPMQEELTSIGVKALKTPQEVEQTIKSDTVLLVINSVCGCAAGNARPAVKMVIDEQKKPEVFATVFAGVDQEAVQKARELMTGAAPSSPAMALFKDGQMVMHLPRHMIEGRTAEEIAHDLKKAFEKFC